MKKKVFKKLKKVRTSFLKSFKNKKKLIEKYKKIKLINIINKFKSNFIKKWF